MSDGLPSPSELAARLDLDPEVAARVLAWIRASLPAASPTASPTTSTHAGLTPGATWVLDPDDAPAEALVRTVDAAQRYEDRGLLGRGGMGEVRRVYDRQLDRTVAMKIHGGDPTLGPARFVDEARTVARLQHPGVLPVHELGRLPDGRVYFTMQEIRGRTLREHVRAVHAAAGADHWRASPDGWTLRRLVAAFQDVCEAVAYAHGEGVVHRDLKPRNVMIGAHGEVLVVDWGLARPRGTPQTGGLVGTPAWLAPELLADDRPPVHPRTDVYALGAILYSILTDRAPFAGETVDDVLAAVRRGPSPVPTSHLPLPDELVELCAHAMTREPAARVGHAGVLAAAVRTWLDGSRKRAQALDLVDRARGVLPEVDALRQQAARTEEEGGRLLAAVPAWAPEADKHAAWDALDRARALRVAAEAREAEAELLLQGALSIDPVLPEAHAELAARTMRRHDDAERRGDEAAAAVARTRLQRHLDALPAHHPGRARLRQHLRGGGWLTLLTEPPGARVVARRVVERDRRAVPGEAEELGTTPLLEVPLAEGSWLLAIEAPAHEPLTCPVRIGRGEHWHATPPGARAPQPLLLLPRGALPAHACAVPAGWTWVGGDPVAFGSADRRRLWVDGLLVERFPVTNARYIAFLDDLLAQGREDEALRLQPRERAGTVGEQGAGIYGRDAAGRFVLRPDSHGDLWRPDEPVLQVDWHGAMAYADWQAARTGQPWRLLCEWEWEKAARGVDERPYPWGHTFDPSRACTRLSHVGHPNPVDVDSFPIDCSVYGVRGLAGNVRDWCLDPFQEVPPPDGSRVVVPSDRDPLRPRVNRGGFWLGNERDARAADRHFHVPTHRAAEVGLRLALAWPVAP